MSDEQQTRNYEDVCFLYGDSEGEEKARLQCLILSNHHIEITNKMQPCTRIYYSNVLLIAQHVSSDTPLIIRSSKPVIAASGFTCICGCRPRPATTDACKTRGCNYSF